MNLRSTLLAIACAAVTMTGCVVTNTNPTGDGTMYATCSTLSNCGPAATRCQSFSAPWSSGTATESICTIACADSSVCPIGWNGMQGYCAVNGFLGNNMQTCIPRCNTTADCDTGMLCLDAQQLSTGASVPYGTRVCVPGAAVTTKMYQTCNTISDCGTSATRCQHYAVTWASGTANVNLCTVACASDSNCPAGANGQLGYCAAQWYLNNDMQTCVPRCYTNADCDPGTTCLDASQLYGTGSAPAGTRLCVPGNASQVPKAPAYSICSSLSDCATGLTACATVSAPVPGTSTTASRNICTDTCKYDTDCPLDAKGTAGSGYCAAAGVVSSAQECVQRCSADTDCNYGFRCADMKDVPSLPYGVSICVPY